SAWTPSRSLGLRKSSGLPTLQASISYRRHPVFWLPRSASRACTVMTSNSSRPACCSTTPSTDGAGTQPKKPIIGLPHQVHAHEHGGRTCPPWTRTHTRNRGLFPSPRCSGLRWTRGTLRPDGKGSGAGQGVAHKDRDARG